MYRYIKSSKNNNTIQWTHSDEPTWDGKQSEYDFGTFYVNDRQFSVTHYTVNEKIPEFENTWFVSSVHPYDNTEYHWAKYKDGSSNVTYLLDRKVVERKTQVVDTDNDLFKVARHLLELDKIAGLTSKIDRS